MQKEWLQKSGKNGLKTVGLQNRESKRKKVGSEKGIELGKRDQILCLRGIHAGSCGLLLSGLCVLLVV